MSDAPADTQGGFGIGIWVVGVTRVQQARSLLGSRSGGSLPNMGGRQASNGMGKSVMTLRKASHDVEWNHFTPLAAIAGKFDGLFGPSRLVKAG